MVGGEGTEEVCSISVYLHLQGVGSEGAEEVPLISDYLHLQGVGDKGIEEVCSISVYLHLQGVGDKGTEEVCSISDYLHLQGVGDKGTEEVCSSRIYLHLQGVGGEGAEEVQLLHQAQQNRLVGQRVRPEVAQQRDVQQTLFFQLLPFVLVQLPLKHMGGGGVGGETSDKSGKSPVQPKS